MKARTAGFRTVETNNRIINNLYTYTRPIMSADVQDCFVVFNTTVSVHTLTTCVALFHKKYILTIIHIIMGGGGGGGMVTVVW